MTAKITPMLALVAVLLAACGAAGPPTADTGADDPVLRVPVQEAKEATGPVEVAGHLIFHEDGSAEMCTALTRSMPPQCAGHSITITGLDPADFDTESVRGVHWTGEVTLEAVAERGILTAS